MTRFKPEQCRSHGKRPRAVWKRRSSWPSDRILKGVDYYCHFMVVVRRRKHESMMLWDGPMLTVVEIGAGRALLAESRKVAGRRFSSWKETAKVSPGLGESLTFDDDDIACEICDIEADRVRLGFTLPQAISLHRKEIYDLPYPGE